MRVDAETLAERIRLTEAAYKRCTLCARRCGVDRTLAPSGFCGLGVDAFVYKEHVHLGEEAFLVPTHTVYLGGCSFRCVFCSDDAWVRRPQAGVRATPEALARRIARRRSEGARSVSFVGGLPDVNLLAILRTLALCPIDTHVVWNTNLYIEAETFDLLEGVVDTWLADHKFGAPRCARLAGVADYAEILEPALLRAHASDARLVVRHLLMPGHVECCAIPVLEWLAAHTPGATVNLMTAYVPMARARELPGLDRRNSRAEIDRAVQVLRALHGATGLVDGVPAW
jgi:putative pyruvate formate lyase activating enzyme